MITAGSLFSGIGGIDLAFALAGFDIRYQVEINPFCRKVLRKHARNYWRNAVQFTDVQQCGIGRRDELSYVDVLAGGFPCQDISNAGKRAGIREGTRSGLWLDFKRLISEVRPRVVFLENVAAITRSGRGGVDVIAHLADMGYVGYAGVVYAADAGAPHPRARWFAVGYAESTGSKRITGTMDEAPRNTEEQENGGIVDSPDQTVGDTRSIIPQRHRTAWQQVASMGHLAQQPERAGGQRADRRNIHQSRMGRNAHGLSDRMDGLSIMRHHFPAPRGEQFDDEPARATSERSEERLTALGNSVVPQCVYPIAKLLYQYLQENRES